MTTSPSAPPVLAEEPAAFQRVENLATWYEHQRLQVEGQSAQDMAEDARALRQVLAQARQGREDAERLRESAYIAGFLDEFGALISDAFGEVPYHVGSSLTGVWRDVDVRLMLDDERYEAEGYGDPLHPHQNPKWVAMVRAFSLLGQQMTGLPIDFQIQQRTDANTRDDGPRSALGIHTYFRRRNT